MSRRHENGGGDAAEKAFSSECAEDEELKANRRLRSAMAQAAMHEIDRIIQEENERCPIQESTVEEDRDKLLPPLYD